MPEGRIMDYRQTLKGVVYYRREKSIRGLGYFNFPNRTPKPLAWTTKREVDGDGAKGQQKCF